MCILYVLLVAPQGKPAVLSEKLFTCAGHVLMFSSFND